MTDDRATPLTPRVRGRFQLTAPGFEPLEGVQMASHHDSTQPNDDQRGTIEVAHAAPHLAVVSLQGEHDISTSESLEQAFAQAAANSNVLVDLTDCTFIDSTVITVLIRTAEAVKAGGEQLVLVIPPAQRAIARVAEMTGLGHLMPLYDSRDAALAALPGSG